MQCVHTTKFVILQKCFTLCVRYIYSFGLNLTQALGVFILIFPPNHDLRYQDSKACRGLTAAEADALSAHVIVKVCVDILITDVTKANFFKFLFLVMAHTTALLVVPSFLGRVIFVFVDLTLLYFYGIKSNIASEWINIVVGWFVTLVLVAGIYLRFCILGPGNNDVLWLRWRLRMQNIYLYFLVALEFLLQYAVLPPLFIFLVWLGIHYWVTPLPNFAESPGTATLLTCSFIALRLVVDFFG